nr:dephospho-CoA kinase [Tanacetum cinerariifolium]
MHSELADIPMVQSYNSSQDKNDKYVKGHVTECNEERYWWLEKGCGSFWRRDITRKLIGKNWARLYLLILQSASSSIVHWNPEAPPRTLPRVRLRCGKAPPCCASSQLRRIDEEGRSHLILPKNRKRSAMPGRGDGKRNGSEERNWGSQCFSTLNEMRQPRDAFTELLAPYIAFGMLSEVFKLWIKGCNIIILDVPLLVLAFNRSFLFWWLLVAAATAPTGMDAGLIMLCFRSFLSVVAATVAGMDAGLIMLCFRSIISVDEETRESLRDTIALLMREELEKLRDEMRKCSGEEFFKVNNIPDESKNKEFMIDNVKDSSCGLHVIDKVGDLLVNNNHCEVNLGRSECAHKMFDEKSIKEFLKQDIIAEYSDAYVRESIEVGKRIVEYVVVETAKVDVEVGNEVVDDDKMGDDSEFLVMEVDRFVTDRNRNLDMWMLDVDTDTGYSNIRTPFIGQGCNLLSSGIYCLQQGELSSLAVGTSSGSENLSLAVGMP